MFSTDAKNLKYIAVSIVKNKDDEVLIIKKKTQQDDLGGVTLTWVFPGGILEENENELEAAARETYAETGYKVKASDLISKRIFPNSTVFIHYVACDLVSDIPSEVIETHEVEEVKWVKPHDLKSHFTSDLDKVVALYLGL